ncbi:hypothetical protein ABZ502_32705 [Streptomyces abikoensis]|uniref:hypothetical protein n=1 Tax=Streptomyces abikoensis TaxID=97398 RepID=UPI0033E71519
MTLRPIRLDLPGIGTLTAHDTVLEHGRVKYTVHGPHIAAGSTFIISPEAHRGGSVVPTTVSVQYGDGPPAGLHYQPRPNEPVIFGTRIHGYTSGLDPERISRRHFLGSYATAASSTFTSRIPDGARTRTEAIVRRLLEHWHTRSDQEALRHAAAQACAAEHAQHEDKRAALLEAEGRKLEAERAAARRRINVLNGLIRRRQPPVLPADSRPVKLPFFDCDGQQLGILTVREKTVNALPGSVVYDVVGPRISGSFTVSRHRHGADPFPDGIDITYGARRSMHSHEADDEPSVNTARLHGSWNHSGNTSAITPTTPARLPARIRTGLSTGCSAPQATLRRASAVLRALAVHYLSRTDLDALDLAAAKDRAPSLLSATRKKLRELRERQQKLTRQAHAHHERAGQYRELLAPPLALPDVQSDPSEAAVWEGEGGAVLGIETPRPVAAAPEQTRVDATREFAEVAQRAVTLASEAADAAELAVCRSRARDTERLDEAMFAAHAEFVSAEQYARWVVQDAGTVTASTLRNYTTRAIEAAERAQQAAGLACTASQLAELIAEPWTQAMAEEQARQERERREEAEQYEAGERDRTGMDADNRHRLTMARYLAQDEVPKLGWSKAMVSVMEQAAGGQLYRKDGFTWNGRRRVKKERVLMLVQAGYLSIGRGQDQRILMTPMGDTALFLARLHPEGIHPDDRTAYEARFAVARRLRRNKEDTKSMARRLPRLNAWTLRRCVRPVTIAEQQARAAEIAEQTWADEGGAIPGVERPGLAMRPRIRARPAGRVGAPHGSPSRSCAGRG